FREHVRISGQALEGNISCFLSQLDLVRSKTSQVWNPGKRLKIRPFVRGPDHKWALRVIGFPSVDARYADGRKFNAGASYSSRENINTGEERRCRDIIWYDRDGTFIYIRTHKVVEVFVLTNKNFVWMLSDEPIYSWSTSRKCKSGIQPLIIIIKQKI